ncbi:MAG: TatD family hydrolase [Rhodospirillales bacterium]
MLVDSHCHLDFPDFAEDFDGVLSRAAAADIETILTICTHVTKFGQIRAIAEAHGHIWCSVGIHPHEAESEPPVSGAELAKLSAHPKCIGIGETGLDYFYEHSPKAEQQRNFRAHIEASQDTGLPLIVHARDADDDTINILSEAMSKRAFPGVIHCFTAGPELARVAVELGLYISISGIVTFKKAEELRSTIADIPLDRLLVETDAPYLAPMPNRGKRNEPSFVRHTAAKVADVKGVTPDELARITTENFYCLFSKARRPAG